MNNELLRSMTKTPDGVAIRLERRYRYAIADVWSAWTEPERLRRWFGEVGGELAPGGTVWMWSDDDGKGGRVSIERCEPPRSLQVVWSYAEEPASRVELTLSPDSTGSATDLVLVHSGLEHVDGVGYGAGWEAFLVAVDAHLQTGEGDTADPQWSALEAAVRPTWKDLAG